MALYTYRGLAAGGGTIRGTIEAPSPREVAVQLREKQIYPLEVKPSHAKRRQLELSFLRRQKLSTAQLGGFCRQLSALLEATIPYDAALGLISEQTATLPLRHVISDVRARVTEGAYLADALAAHPQYFPPLMTSLIRSGETSGALAQIVQRLAAYYDQRHKLNQRVVSAMIYPLFMALFSVAVVIFMLTYIIPKIAVLFESVGAQLPLMTRLLIGSSTLIVNYWWLAVGTLLGGLLLVSRLLRTERGALWRDRLVLRLPLVHKLLRKLIIQRFMQTLATLLGSGVELKTALSVAKDVMGNRVYLHATEQVIFEVQNRGASLAAALQRTGLFTQEVLHMLSIGEETATLPKMLNHSAERLAQDVTSVLESVTALIEPVMIMIMGAVVGFIVVSVLLPLLQLNQLVG